MEKRAIVFSAGGAFGAYHAGAWAALADEFKPDMVVGTSIGSLNAWLAASDVAPTRMREIWMDPAMAPRLKVRVPRSIRDGVLDCDPLEERIRELHESVTPRRPIGVVAVAWGEFKPKLFRDEEIGWRHLAASCAIPVILRQQRVEGRTYMDGGIFDSVNIWAAIEMGATRIIAINAWKPDSPGWYRQSVGWVAARGRRRSGRVSAVEQAANAETESIRVEIIEPSGALGKFRDSLFWTRENAERWYALGAADVERKKHSLCDMF